MSRRGKGKKMPVGDPANGGKLFKSRCTQCHTIGKGAPHKQGYEKEKKIEKKKKKEDVAELSAISMSLCLFRKLTANLLSMK
jgi:cytochrome c2